jgi:hypothetical protein
MEVIEKAKNARKIERRITARIYALLVWRFQLQPHDRPCSRPPHHFAKAGFAECRSQASPGEGVREGALARFDRVTFEQPSTVSLSMGGGRAQ